MKQRGQYLGYSLLNFMIDETILKDKVVASAQHRAYAKVLRNQNSSPSHLQLTVRRSETGWRLINLTELWKYRELLYFLTWRDG